MPVSDDAEAVRFEVTLPCDVRFRAMRDCIVERLTACLGYDEADALTRAVILAASGVLDHADGAVYSSVMITFTAGAGVLTTRVRYLVESGAPGTAAEPTVERILSDGGRGRDAPLVVLRRLAGRVEVGRVEGAECCTLVTPLPAAT